MPTKAIQDYLKQKNVAYTTISHPVAYAAREISHVCNIPEAQLAKTVVIYAGKKVVMVVLPACDSIDFYQLKKALNETDVSLTSEQEFSKLFPDCEVGAMPPFGDLYNMDVYIDKALADNPQITFNAGTHNELIKLSFKDFKTIAHPTVIQLH